MDSMEGKVTVAADLQKALTSARTSKDSYQKLVESTPIPATKQIFQDMVKDMQRHIDQLDSRIQTVSQSAQFDKSN
jgi:rubrerythrin